MFPCSPGFASLSTNPIILPEIDTSPVITNLEIFPLCDQPVWLLPFRYKFLPWSMLIAALYVFQLAPPSTEFPNLDYFLPRYTMLKLS